MAKDDDNKTTDDQGKDTGTGSEGTENKDTGLTDEEAKKLLAAGGSSAAGKDDDTDSDDEDDNDPPGTDKLGDAGQRALSAMKEQRKAARAERDAIKQELADARAKLKGHEDKDKTEAQRLQEQATEATARAERAESAVKRREAAEESAPDDATPKQIRTVYELLEGVPADKLDARAEQLFGLMGASKPPKTPLAGKPKTRLQGGSGDDDNADEMDPAKLAAMIPRR
jgi:hypothetical protein